jgi:hypothetical protein
MEKFDIRRSGKLVTVPSTQIDGRTVVITGSWLRLASVHDEEVFEQDVVTDPELYLNELKIRRCGADLFTFRQAISAPKPQYHYPFEWDNAAVIGISSYQNWWTNRPSSVKGAIKKSQKIGISVRSVPFDDDLVKGICAIYNESPVRQGRRFWHYGKSFDQVQTETSHSLKNSEFIGAYFEGELVGFAKLLYVGSVADIVLILSRQKYRSANVLLAKAVELCAQRGISSLVYARFQYGKKRHSSLTDFKRRNGFEKVAYPRYYVPLTSKGKIAARLKLYRDWKDVLPESVSSALLMARAYILRFFAGAHNQTSPAGDESRSQ